VLESLTQNLLDPAILFFVLGVFVASIRSNLDVPPAIAKFLSLYLLIAIGMKGGTALAKEGLPVEGVLALIVALAMAALVPAWSYLILRRRVDPFDAAAIAATYGSVSAVTFVVSQQYLTNQGIAFGGYMAVAMVLMESPAIVMAVLLASLVRAQATAAANGGGSPPPLSMKKVLHEAFTDGAHLLLIGSLIVGFVAGERGAAMMAPFTAVIFKGLLAFFLLEMGLLVGRQLVDAQAKLDRFLLGFALLVPILNASIALAAAALLGLQRGDATMLAVLSASASYIVVPAIVRYAIPEARPGIYFFMSLAVTFPFNILFGIPLYHEIAGLWWT
jgi:hypothetical protein